MFPGRQRDLPSNPAAGRRRGAHARRERSHQRGHRAARGAPRAARGPRAGAAEPRRRSTRPTPTPPRACRCPPMRGSPRRAGVAADACQPGATAAGRRPASRPARAGSTPALQTPRLTSAEATIAVAVTGREHVLGEPERGHRRGHAELGGCRQRGRQRAARRAAAASRWIDDVESRRAQPTRAEHGGVVRTGHRGPAALRARRRTAG